MSVDFLIEDDEFITIKNDYDDEYDDEDEDDDDEDEYDDEYDDEDEDDDYDDDDDEEEDDDDDDEDEEVVVSYACEDCDYRWDITFQDKKDAEIDESQYCPMCGSVNSIQI